MEMIERVAQAILEHLRHCTDISSHSDGLKNVGLEDAWIDLNKVAMVAIQAMREPTATMIAAGVHHENMGDMTGRWQAMIDEALRDD